MEANGDGDSGGAETGMDCAGAGNELESEAPIADRRPAHPAPAVAGSFHQIGFLPEPEPGGKYLGSCGAGVRRRHQSSGRWRGMGSESGGHYVLVFVKVRGWVGARYL